MAICLRSCFTQTGLACGQTGFAGNKVTFLAISDTYWHMGFQQHLRDQLAKTHGKPISKEDPLTCYEMPSTASVPQFMADSRRTKPLLSPSQLQPSLLTELCMGSASQHQNGSPPQSKLHLDHYESWTSIAKLMPAQLSQEPSSTVSI